MFSAHNPSCSSQQVGLPIRHIKMLLVSIASWVTSGYSNNNLFYYVLLLPLSNRAALSTNSVPNAPQNDPEVLYIFTGLQNVDWIPIVDPEPPVFDIIQVVKQTQRVLQQLIHSLHYNNTSLCCSTPVMTETIGASSPGM